MFRKAKWKLWNQGTNYLRSAHEVVFPVTGLARFPNKVFRSYADVWRAAFDYATASDLHASEEDWKSTFRAICYCKKTLIPATTTTKSRVRISENESLALLAFKKRIDAQWDWLHKPKEKSKKKKQGEEYVFLFQRFT